jgi:hypothetical protein
MNFVVIRSRPFLHDVLRRDLFSAVHFGATHQSILRRLKERELRAMLRFRGDFRAFGEGGVQNARFLESGFQDSRSSEHQPIADDPIHYRVDVSWLDHDGVAPELSFGRVDREVLLHPFFGRRTQRSKQEQRAVVLKFEIDCGP